MAATYNNLYLDARRTLKAAGSDNPQLEAQELLCFAAEKGRQELLRDMALYASAPVTERFEGLLKRRLAGEPVAYLIGEWEFYGMTLDISPDVLVPRDDTEILARQAIERTSACPGEPRVLDLCAGSGCVGLAIASQCPQARVVLGELDDGALKICRQNIRRNNLSARVMPVQMDAREKPARSLGEFHCIVGNPPYIPAADIAGLEVSVRDYEPRLALDGGADGLDFYRVISEQWKEALVPGGRLYFEVGVGQADAVLRLMRSQGFGDLQIIKDHHKIPRVVLGTLCREI